MAHTAKPLSLYCYINRTNNHIKKGYTVKNENKIELIGYAGSALYITAFFLVSQGHVDGQGLIFNLMNLTGAVLYLIYASIKKLLPVLILEIFWGATAIYALAKLL